MMKFALFLVCALVAVQGYEARSVEPDTLALRGMMDKIKEMIEKIMEFITIITSQIPEIIKKINEQFQAIFERITEYIKEIIKKLDEISVAGEIGRKCVEAQRDDIEALIQFAQFAIQGCYDEVMSNTEALSEQVEVLAEKINAVRDDVTNRAFQCVKDNPSDASSLVKCLKEQVEPIKNEIIALRQEVDKTIAIANEVAEQAGAALIECTNKVHDEMAEREQKIMENVKQCIKESTP